VASIRPVVLSGGAGTRLWPLSTTETPKQFATLVGERSLFSLTLERLNGTEGLVPAIIVTGEAHVDLVSREIAASSAATGLVAVEPEGRNTAPAAIAAALLSSDDDVLVILPSDHLISDEDGFREAVGRAAHHAGAGSIVMFGIRPSRPDIGFGYMTLGDPNGDGYLLAGFEEKPSLPRAVEIVEAGTHLWNSGVFVVRADALIAEAGEHCPDVLAAVRSSIPSQEGAIVRLGPEFTSSPSVSLDNAIMEKTARGVVLPVDFGWNDLGSYRSLLESLPRDEDGNHISGDVVASGVSGSYVNATSRRLVVAGVEGLVVVETPEVVLVIPIDLAQEVRDLARRFESH
jgi:mannose-1-phosphate guanylyltransferase/mannose-6-phosphate isomerase